MKRRKMEGKLRPWLFIIQYVWVGNIGTAAGRRRLLNFTGTRQNRCEIFTRNMYTEIRTRLKTNARLELD